MHNNYAYKILEYSEQNIVRLEDIKNYMRISGDNDDNLIIFFINSSIQTAENFMKISLTKKVIEVQVDNSSDIRLPFVPVLEIMSVEVNNKKLDADEFILNKDILTLKNHVGCEKLKIIYSTGHQDPINIPMPVIQGIMSHIANMYDMRGVDLGSIDNILSFYKPYRRMII